MHEQCCIDWRAAQEPLIYPPRMIALRIPPRAVVEVNGPARNARVSDAERHEHECSERRINIGFGCLFDQAPNQKIARVRIRPGLPRAEEKRIKTYARQKLGVRPWHVAALDGRKIFGPSGIAAQATRMLEQLTQCVGSITQRNVEREATARNEHKRTGSEAGLADTSTMARAAHRPRRRGCPLRCRRRSVACIQARQMSLRLVSECGPHSAGKLNRLSR